MKRFLLWSFDRGSAQYDVICGLILAFIFLVPSTRFNDRPGYMRVFSSDPEIKATSENGITVYTVKLKSAAFWDDEPHRQLALKSLEESLKIPVDQYRMKPIYTTIGMTIAYAIWVEEVK
jgi:hypothetical protein